MSLFPIQPVLEDIMIKKSEKLNNTHHGAMHKCCRKKAQNCFPIEEDSLLNLCTPLPCGPGSHVQGHHQLITVQYT